MNNLDQIPKDYLDSLEKLENGPVLEEDASTEDRIAYIYLSDLGFVSRHLPDPNSLYQLPEQFHGKPMYSLTLPGEVVCKLLKDHREQMAQQRAAEEAKERAQAIEKKLAKQETVRNQYKQTIFTAILTLALEHCFDIAEFIKQAIVPILAFFQK